MLTLLHTNDSHGRFGIDRSGRPLPAVEGLEQALRQVEPDLWLDAGDTVSAGNLGFHAAGEPALETLQRLGCAAMTLGNRETHPRKEIFPVKVRSAGAPLLCANVRAREGAPLPAAPHLILERGGVRIGVFGVTVPMFRRSDWTQFLCDYFFEPPMEEAERQVEELRPQVDLLIALTHIGFNNDLKLAARLPALDLVIGGHSHTDLVEPEWVGDLPVLTAYAFGYYAGVARLDPNQPRCLIEWRRQPLRPRE